MGLFDKIKEIAGSSDGNKTYVNKYRNDVLENDALSSFLDETSVAKLKAQNDEEIIHRKPAGELDLRIVHSRRVVYDDGTSSNKIFFFQRTSFTEETIEEALTLVADNDLMLGKEDDFVNFGASADEIQTEILRVYRGDVIVYDRWKNQSLYLTEAAYFSDSQLAFLTDLSSKEADIESITDKYAQELSDIDFLTKIAENAGQFFNEYQYDINGHLNETQAKSKIKSFLKNFIKILLNAKDKVGILNIILQPSRILYHIDVESIEMVLESAKNNSEISTGNLPSDEGLQRIKTSIENEFSDIDDFSIDLSSPDYRFYIAQATPFLSMDDMECNIDTESVKDESFAQWMADYSPYTSYIAKELLTADSSIAFAALAAGLHIEFEDECFEDAYKPWALECLTGKMDENVDYTDLLIKIYPEIEDCIENL